MYINLFFDIMYINIENCIKFTSSCNLNFFLAPPVPENCILVLKKLYSSYSFSIMYGYELVVFVRVNSKGR